MLILMTILLVLVTLIALGNLILAWQGKLNHLLLSAKLEAQQQQLTTLSNHNHEQLQNFSEQFNRFNHELRDRFEQFREQQQQHSQQLQHNLTQQGNENLNTILKNLTQGIADLRKQVHEILSQNTKNLADNMQVLTKTTNEKLHMISGQVEQRLNEGFEKTTATFTDIMKRLTIIDEAQKRITELSSNVVSLQAILSDKRSRGAFGEVQLSALIKNVIPESHFSLQHSLSNGMRVDCILLLPAPTGNIAIDAKFPLETYRLLSEKPNPTDNEKRQLQQQFRQDLRKHIQDIAGKYIIPGETADGAVMFIPAEAIFAEIHANYPDIVELAQRHKVWLVSPTTMMAILTTARAVIKDDATRKQVHIIQEHLRKLAKNFNLFQNRMDKLATHIRQAHTDVDQIHVSAEKISKQFEKIEKVELAEQTTEETSLLSDD